MTHDALVLVPLAALLCGVALELVLARTLSNRAKGWLAVAACLGALGGVLALWPTTYHGQAVNWRAFAWDGPVTLAYHVDGLAQLFALMGAGIGLAVLVYSVGYMAKDRSATRFYVLMLVFIAGLINLVYSADLFVMYASWELVGLCSFFLVGFWYTRREAAAGARKVLVMTHIAGYALLAAILVIYVRTGTTVWTDPSMGKAFTTGLFVLMLISATAKSVQFPLHTWIPSAMEAPTPVSSLLHAACYVKAGVYLVARMHSFAPWPVSWQTTVIWLGTATMLIGVLFAMVQHDLKRLLAYHTVSQIGYMMLGIGLGTPLGVIAGLLQCLNHAFFKGGLFLCAGSVQRATGTRDMDRLGGLARRMPRTAATWMIVAGGIAGVPLLNGFVSKWLVYAAALRAGQTVPALISWIVSVLTMFSFMKATSGVFFGTSTADTREARESPPTMVAGMVALAAGTIVLGVAPQLPIKYIIEPALKGMGLRSDVAIGPLGIVVPGGVWYTTVGLVFALAALAGGAAIWWLGARAGRGTRVPAQSVVAAGVGAGVAPALPEEPLGAGRLQGIGVSPALAVAVASAGAFSGGEPLSRASRLGAGDFSAIFYRGLRPFYDWVDPDRYYLAVWRATLAVTARVARLGVWLERHALVVLPPLVLGVGALLGFAARPARKGALRVAVPDRWPLLPALGLALVALVLVALATPALRRRVWLFVVAGGLSLAALAITSELGHVAALEAASFVAFVAVYRTQTGRRAGWAYLMAVALSTALLVTGIVTMDSGPAGLVLALLLAGFALKLALVPTYLWLPTVAEHTPAAVAGLVLAVVDVAAVAELIALRGRAPWLFHPAWPWLILGLLTAVGAAGLALAQNDVKRLLAFAAVADAGYVVLGVALGGRFGLAGATLTIAVQAIAAALLFSAIAGAERDAPVTLRSRGLARRHPLAAAGFAAGALAALGVPPTAGYAGHWRLYLTAYTGSPEYLGALIVATALLVLAYARVIAVCWWGGEGDAAPAADAARSIWRSEPLPVAVAVVSLIIVVVAAGMWPRML